MAKIFHKLVDYKNAIELLSDSIRTVIEVKEENLNLLSGKISAEDLYSKEDNPPFDRSEVDGYAVKHTDLFTADDDNPVTLKLIGEIEPGSQKLSELKGDRTCIYIATGAPVPRGADAVVMVEYTKREGDKIYIYRPVFPGENISHAGSDFTMNELILRRNERITPEKIAIIAASGYNNVKIFKKLKVALLSTGNEIVGSGDPLSFGEIYDVNGPYLLSVFNSTSLVEADYIGILKDDYFTIKQHIEYLNKKYPVIITSGSTSAGFHDLLYTVLDDLGGRPIYHGISIKPGKPSFLYNVGNSIVIGLPGFPLSAASVLYTVILPAIYKAYGYEMTRTERGKLAIRVSPEKGKTNIFPAIVSRTGELFPVFGESGSISRLSQSDGFIMLSGDFNVYERGDEVEFYPLFKEKRDLISIGSNDPLLEEVISSTTNKFSIINSGSLGGVEAMKNGYSDISGVHLYEKGIYNRFVMDEHLKKVSHLIRGFDRVQGFISRDGISSFKEIIHRNAIFVNRNRGSGTRAIIDEIIETELGKDFDKYSINNYFWEAKSHAAVARSVLQGRADVGITIKYYADMFNLRFKEIKRESYDILISKSFLSSELGMKFIDNLKKLKSRDNPSGYFIPDEIGQILE